MDIEVQASVTRMSRDIRAAAQTLTDQEARYLVDAYYQMQEDRIRGANRVDAMADAGEPNLVIGWLAGQSSTLETQIKGALDRYTNAQPIGKWMRSIKGIGPVISAGYIANIDIAKANTAGKLWKYCGVAPGADRRVRGQKMAYNPSLKRLAYLTGESFKRLSSDDPEAYYRHWYDRRKLYEIASNEAGKYAEQAAAILSSKKIGKTTDAYKAYSAGKLPPAHIDRRACRWTTKLFLSHLQETWWTMKTGEPPPRPFALSVMGHADYIAPP